MLTCIIFKPCGCVVIDLFFLGFLTKGYHIIEYISEKTLYQGLQNKQWALHLYIEKATGRGKEDF